MAVMRLRIFFALLLASSFVLTLLLHGPHSELVNADSFDLNAYMEGRDTN